MTPDSSAHRRPDFIGVGPPRTATTWLHEALKGHAALPAEKKETDFYSKNYEKGYDWYLYYFRDADPKLPMGEFSPTYFNSEPARERIARDVPGCRIICSFRDPVERAYSHWRLMVRNVWTKTDFEQTVMTRRELRESSRYGHYLDKWRQALGRENVLAIFHEDLEADPQRFVDTVCDFIGAGRFSVARSPVAGQRVHAVPVAPRNRQLARNARKLLSWLNEHRYHQLAQTFRRSAMWRFCAERGEPFAPITIEVEAKLRDYLRPEVEELERLTGRNLSSWKSVRSDRKIAGNE